MNRLVISDNIVELQKNKSFVALELSFKGNLFVENLLDSESSIFLKGPSKIIIIDFFSSFSDNTELFKYDGECNITSAQMVNSAYQTTLLDIDNNANQSWNKLQGIRLPDYTFNKMKWEDMTADYNNMKHNGRNDNYYTTDEVFIEKPDSREFLIERTSVFRHKSDRLKKDKGITTKDNIPKSLKEFSYKSVNIKKKIIKEKRNNKSKTNNKRTGGY